MSVCAAVCLAILSSAVDANVEGVHQSARQIPVIGRRDVVVVGGSLGAVAAAAQAAEAGSAARHLNSTAG